MTAKAWLVNGVRRLVGLHHVLQSVKDCSNDVIYRLGEVDPWVAAAARDNRQFAKLGLDQEVPCLVEMNGDKLWLPADLLRYIWHTRSSAPGEALPRFLAETEHYLWIRERLRRGDDALDVGSNLGLFTVMMANRVADGPRGTVHAFEPSPAIHRDLCRVLRLNQLANVTANKCAVADACGTALFHDVEAHNVMRESSCLESTARAGLLGEHRLRTVETPTVTIDDYVGCRGLTPRLIKIDVEGAEFLVLEGARSCLRRVRPLLVVEIHEDRDGAFDHARLCSYLDEHGYRYRCRGKTYYCE